MTTSSAQAASPAHETGSNSDVLLKVDDVVKHFEIRGGLLGVSQVGNVKAVDGVSFSVNRGEALGLVGESGCGKTTLGKVLLRLLPATSGRVEMDGQVLFDIPPKGEHRKPLFASADAMKKVRRDMQVVFQDPYASLNPRMSVGELIGEGPLVHGMTDKKEREALVRDMLGRVGLNQSHIHRYPHEFSGGQRQRIGIARALALLSAVPEPNPHRRKKRIILKGDIPSPANPPSGCRFHTRCWLREQLGRPERCTTEEPELRDLGHSQQSACHFAEEISSAAVADAVSSSVVVPAATN